MTSRERPLAIVSAASLLVGVGLMVAFEATLPRLLGVLLLIAFIVCGAFLIASPDYLARGEGDRDEDWPPTHRSG